MTKTLSKTGIPLISSIRGPIIFPGKKNYLFSPKRPTWASQAAIMVKNLPANSGDIRDSSSIPRSGRSPGGGNGNPLQYSCLEDSMDRGAWQATVQGVTKSRTDEHTGTPRALVDAGWIKYLLLPRYHHVGDSFSESCSVVSNSLRSHGLYSPWNSPSQNTGVGSFSLLQGIFPT